MPLLRGWKSESWGPRDAAGGQRAGRGTVVGQARAESQGSRFGSPICPHFPGCPWQMSSRCALILPSVNKKEGSLHVIFYVENAGVGASGRVPARPPRPHAGWTRCVANALLPKPGGATGTLQPEDENYFGLNSAFTGAAGATGSHPHRAWAKGTGAFVRDPGPSLPRMNTERAVGALSQAGWEAKTTMVEKLK